MILIAIYCLIYFAAAAATIWLASKAQQFHRRHPGITDAASLEAFKDLARRNMYFALVQILVLLVGIALGLVLLSRHGFVGFLLVTVTNGALLLLSLWTRTIEKAVRSLSVSTPELRTEYDKVCHSWMKKPFPDF